MKDLLNFSLINIDKPAGPTSYSVSEFVRRKLGLKKTSHMGTLDPKVTGVLPITLGRACKLAGYFIKHDKSYVGVLECHKVQDIKELQKLIDENFTGKIKQTPPHRSAVLREERIREVFFWKLLEVGSPSVENLDSLNRKSSSQSDGKAHAERGDLGNKGKSFLFECRVQGGTYIRKLCSDLGEMIGGAHMGELRRTEAGVFSETAGAGRPLVLVDRFTSRLLRCEMGEGELVNLHDFVEAVRKWKNGNDEKLREMLVPAEDAIKKVLPVVEVDKSAVKSLYTGKPLFTSNIVKDVDKISKGDVFALFCGDVFIGIYRRTGEEIIFGRSEFVCN